MDEDADDNKKYPRDCGYKEPQNEDAARHFYARQILFKQH
jgi:hypothetical protein